MKMPLCMASQPAFCTWLPDATETTPKVIRSGLGVPAGTWGAGAAVAAVRARVVNCMVKVVWVVGSR